jgi:hypothetical protein
VAELGELVGEIHPHEPGPFKGEDDQPAHGS